MTVDSSGPERFKPEKPARLRLGDEIAATAKRLGAVAAVRPENPGDSETQYSFAYLKNMPPVPMDLLGGDGVAFSSFEDGFESRIMQLIIYKDGEKFVREADDNRASRHGEYTIVVLNDGPPFIQVESGYIDTDLAGQSASARDNPLLLNDQECTDLIEAMNNPELERYVTSGEFVG